MAEIMKAINSENYNNGGMTISIGGNKGNRYKSSTRRDAEPLNTTEVDAFATRLAVRFDDPDYYGNNSNG
jgi:hypothetical protein